MVKIKKYEKKDCDRCIDILKMTLLPWDVDNLIEDLKEDYDCERYLSTLDDRVIALGGYYKPKEANFEYEKYLMFFKKYVCLDWIAVDPEYQKAGIGKNLIKYCEEDAKDKGYTHMAVWTVVPEYFQKLGYEYLKDYDYSEDEQYETYLMLKKIK